MFEVMSWRDMSAAKKAHEKRVYYPRLCSVEGMMDDAKLLIMAARKETRKAQAT
jgi:hypothetical protein